MNKNRIRHKALGLLVNNLKTVKEKYGAAPPIDIYHTYIPLKDALTIIKVDEHQFRTKCVKAVMDESMKYVDNYDGIECIAIAKNTLLFYHEQKYLKDIWEVRNSNIYNISKWAIPIAAMIVSTYLALKSISNSNEVKNGLKESNIKIGTLQTKVDSIIRRK